MLRISVFLMLCLSFMACGANEASKSSNPVEHSEMIEKKDSIGPEDDNPEKIKYLNQGLNPFHYQV